LRGSKLSGGQK
jgi:ABC-type multidrug transport system fused ATPase/permease subunit